MTTPASIDDVVKFHGLDGIDHDARVLKVHANGTVDLQLMDAGPQKRNDKLERIAHGPHTVPFRWHRADDAEG